MSSNLTRSVVIVGGGTSGWLCAAYMANRIGGLKEGDFSITLVESADIPTIGVGEATIPPIKSAIAATGLTEPEFFKATNASFKMAIRFDGWMKPSENGEHSFYHAFGQHGRIGSEPLAPYWLLDETTKGRSFVDYSMNNGPIIEAMRGPKRASDPQFSGPLDYAYHFDAGLLAELLKKRAIDLGVKHVVDTVKDVERDGETIIAIQTDGSEKLEADLFVDCTGFNARLIEKELGEPFVSQTDVLFCDSAMAIQVPYDSEDAPVPPYTKSVARKNGWIWDVPLYNRRGTGIVYSSRHASEDEARAELLEYLGDAAGDAQPRGLKFRVGYRERPWRGNCVALGLSGGFVEPLESTGIYVIDIAIRWLTDFCTAQETYEQAADAFNERLVACYRDIIDFVKMHYVLSDRDDTEFWRENREAQSIPDSLRDKLAMWSTRMPSEYEFGHLPAVFSYSNYVQIMMAMGHHPPIETLRMRHRQVDHAKGTSAELAKVAQSGLNVLPNHRALLDAIRATA